MPTAYIDFDGTICDPMPRYSAVLNACLRALGAPDVPLEAYRRLKPLLGADDAIAHKATGYRIEDVAAYRAFRREALEQMDFLSLDPPLGDVETALNLLREKGYAPVVLSRRRKPENLRAQLRKMGLFREADEALVASPERGSLAKAELILARRAASATDGARAFANGSPIGDTSEGALYDSRTGGARAFANGSPIGGTSGGASLGVRTDGARAFANGSPIGGTSEDASLGVRTDGARAFANDLLIGDSPDDVRCARAAGIRPLFVRSGLFISPEDEACPVYDDLWAAIRALNYIAEV